MILLFYIFSALIIIASVSLLFLKNLVHAALMLIVALVCIAGVFVLAGADFLAMAQIMIYVGGVLVLILFGIMLTNRTPQMQYPHSTSRNTTFGIILAMAILVPLLILIENVNFDHLVHQQKAVVSASTLQQIGLLLMTKNIIAFELAGILLMVALMGASMLAMPIIKSIKK